MAGQWPVGRLGKLLHLHQVNAKVSRTPFSKTQCISQTKQHKLLWENPVLWSLQGVTEKVHNDKSEIVDKGLDGKRQSKTQTTKILKKSWVVISKILLSATISVSASLTHTAFKTYTWFVCNKSCRTTAARHRGLSCILTSTLDSLQHDVCSS